MEEINAFNAETNYGYMYYDPYWTQGRFQVPRLYLPWDSEAVSAVADEPYDQSQFYALSRYCWCPDGDCNSPGGGDTDYYY